MTVLAFTNGHILLGDRIVPSATVRIEAGRIADIAADVPVDGTVVDLDGGWLLPGFVDSQVNGGGGALLNNDITVEGLATIAQAHARFGTTALMPTLITDTPAAISAALDVVDAAIAQGLPGIVGLHIEGPFINAVRKGVHDPALIRHLDEDLLAELCRPRRGKVMLTIAPEQVEPQALERLRAAGVIISAGHTNATFAEAQAGFAAGLTGVTHLYNAMSPLLHRAPGVVGAALLNDAVWCGIIADGVHVAGPALEIALRMKGTERLMLVTDAMPSVGMSAGSFELNGRTITVTDGVCQDENGTLAGSSLDMAGAVRTMVALTSADVPMASRMASATPAAFLGLADEIGTLATGQRADMVWLDAALQPVQCWIGGGAVI
ncbi:MULTISPECIES: N-acetylglucosamine-6-phosphate deacetylase [unclassified Novosphingobium]|uniref:N-acetylglucosamine-6-phosphate deacetylase n=1 Tax=unclassified Novosphingobium TaxID=2644732 RepID=UPI0014941467|nr:MULTISPECIES: N-acetylglucosamine-6-phosphate deacetylase [unclassified Novosphingobium]MBB3357922.1 N-acetylglucosamine-6-phosphate deacetylase [Novosphingobium sp. BK256]MBB3374283.1 N-acetylglucosamine-6-phosphate deacetylase [Novosphingobium sp. BK280]MBB3378695.1 N-acetylglucosamine-6-phosphate deacetylase [Novosphingobium sp. BK258]MBB3420389.1 N-acetylglucosamine-6-phosphate deacetylase [Novosphingobium sp. BK267]MBB3448489.1 N-acetylglucosamine-6-phosphate deacetylase [Novosphingobi